MDAAVPTYPPLEDRPIKNTIVLFDVDNTLSPPRLVVSPEMLAALSRLRQKVAVGFVGGSDLVKQQEQLGTADRPVTSMFDFCFSENGLTAYKLGAALPSASFIGWIGEQRYKDLVRFCLHYIADLDIPVKRGTFIEFRNGMINVSPIGRNASTKERGEYQEYDLAHKIRETFIEKLKEQFSDLDLSYSIGGQISFDVFPRGWDKRYCLSHLEAEAQKPGGIAYSTVHFYGDKCFPGGNDHEIYEDPRTVGHSVKDPDDTLRMLKEEFDI
ncbi:eukaryotic phosphomannomutase [Xylariaceae sp. FL0016]|nr:eukaryotic phosphomannomutase [Xylariaceae sp. FL0016]